jgi:hypothetical protein
MSDYFRNVFLKVMEKLVLQNIDLFLIGQNLGMVSCQVITPNHHQRELMRDYW